MGLARSRSAAVSWASCSNERHCDWRNRRAASAVLKMKALTSRRKAGLIAWLIVIEPTMAMTSAGAAAAIEKARTTRKCSPEPAAPRRHAETSVQPSITTRVNTTSRETTLATNSASAAPSLTATGVRPASRKNVASAHNSAKPTATAARRCSRRRLVRRAGCGAFNVSASDIGPQRSALFRGNG